MSKKKSRNQKVAETTKSNLFDFLSLKNVRLVESHSKLNIVDGVVPAGVEVSLRVQLAASSDRRICLGTVSASVATPVPEGKRADEVSTVTLEVIIQCVFDSEESLPAPETTTLSEEESNTINATITYIAWPYLRAHVQAMSASMGIPPITLGLFRIKQSPSEAAAE